MSRSGNLCFNEDSSSCYIVGALLMIFHFFQDVMVLWMEARMCPFCLWCDIEVCSSVLGVFPLYFLCFCSLDVFICDPGLG